MITSQSVRRSLRVAGLVMAAIAGLCVGPRAFAQTIPDFDTQPGLALGQTITFDAKVDLVGAKSSDAIRANDIDIAPNGKIWIASDHGLLEQAGFGWNVRRLTTPIIGKALGPQTAPLGARRIDIDPVTGTIWVVDANDTLAERQKDGSLQPVVQGVRDFGVYDGRLWIIPIRYPDRPRATDGAILTGTRDKLDAFYGWHDHLGAPTAIDVAPDGVAWITTDSGLIVRSHDDQNRPGRWTVQNTPDCIDPATGSAAGCASSGRRLTDIAMIDAESAWVSGVEPDGPIVRLFTNGLRLSAGLTQRRGLRALAADDRGHLTAITDAGVPITAPLQLLMTAKTPESLAALLNGTQRPDRTNMRVFGDGAAPISLGIPIGGAPVDHAQVLNPSNDLTIAFSAMPVESGPGEGAAPQCLLALRSAQRETFSICLDATQTKLTVRIGKAERTVPVALGGLSRDGKPIARRFVLQTKFDEAQLFTVEETWKADATWTFLQVIDTARVQSLASFEFPTMTTDTSPSLRLIIGGRTATTDLYRGHLGPVRIWRSAEIDPAVLFAAHDAGRWANAQSPAPRDLVVDAPLAPVAGQAAAANDTGAVELLSPVDLGGLWYAEEDGEYDSRAIEFSKNSQAFSAHRIQVFRIAPTPADPAKPSATGGLDIFRDGDGGVVETRFLQAAANGFLGWREPQQGRFASGFRPFALEVIDSDRLRLIDLNSGSTTLFKRIGEPTSKGGPGSLIDRPYESYVGYDFLQSPFVSSKGAGGRRLIFSNVPRDDAGKLMPLPKDRKVPWGLIYDNIDKGVSKGTERVVETTRELQEDLRANVGAGAEMPEVFSFSASADFKEKVDRMESEKSVLAIGELWFAGYGLILDPARVALEPDFRTLIERAAVEAPGATRNGRIDEILKTYGTHYTNFVVFGCSARYERKISETTISSEIEQQIDVKAASSGSVSGVTISLEGAFGRGMISKVKKGETLTDTEIVTQGATVSFDAEEVTCGEQIDRGNSIARDLRPITDVLSPIFFKDPAIYRDLRNAVGLRLIERMRAAPGRVLVSDAQNLPEFYIVKLESLTPANLGTDNVVEGTVKVSYTPAGTRERKVVPIWTGKDRSAARPSLAEGNAVAIGKSVVVSVDSNDIDAQLIADLTGPGSPSKLGTVTEQLYLGSARASGNYASEVAAIAPECQCVTACPAGYGDENGACLKSCPNGFDSRGATCFGSYPRTYYPLWDMDVCNQENPSVRCQKEGWGIYPKCKENHRNMPFGWCQPECSKFGLEVWGGTNVTCSRPTAARSASGRSPSNSCPVGATPGVDCARVGIAYAVEKVTFVH